MVIQIDTSGNDARSDEAEEVWFGDDGPYEFFMPKVAPLLGAMRRLQRARSDEEAGSIATEAQEKWLSAGFGPDQWARIQGRLDDMDDDLDWVHLFQLFEALFKAATGRPPTSPGGFSATSVTRSSGVSARPVGSTRTS